MANYGKDTIGANYLSSLAGWKRFCKFTSPADIGEVDTIGAYLDRTSTGGGYAVTGGIYTDNAGAPDALVADSAIQLSSNISRNSPNWYTVDYSVKPVLQPDTVYWLGVHFEKGSCLIYYDAGDSNQFATSLGDSYTDGLSDPFGSANYSAYAMSVYVSYIAGGPVLQEIPGVLMAMASTPLASAVAGSGTATITAPLTGQGFTPLASLLGGSGVVSIDAPLLAQALALLAPDVSPSGAAEITAPLLAQALTELVPTIQGSGIASIDAPVSAQDFVALVPIVEGSGVASISAPLLAQAYTELAALVELVGGLQEITAPLLAMAFTDIAPTLQGSGIAEIVAPLSSQSFAVIVPAMGGSGVAEITASLLAQGYTVIAPDVAGSGTAEIVAPLSGQSFTPVASLLAGSGVVEITAPLSGQLFTVLAGLAELIGGGLTAFYTFEEAECVGFTDVPDDMSFVDAEPIAFVEV